MSLSTTCRKLLRSAYFSQLLFAFFFMFSCERGENHRFAFTALDQEHTGLHFQNNLINTDSLNFLDFIDFYNGSGIGAGDFNNDGLIDLYFGANMEPDKLFLNQGGLTFRDVSPQAIPQEKTWTNGVSVVDINDDGWLDIYICKLGYFRGIIRAKNQFLINKGVNDQGIPVFKDEALLYGLDFSGYSNQALFADFDEDNDLDVFLLNYNPQQHYSSNSRSFHQHLYDPYSGDKLFENQNGTFVEVTQQCGILGSPAGLGLGVAMGDFNMDGYPDLYICNDFSENDYLYINQKNGTFRDELTQHITHTSKSSMGVDVGDFNNDGFSDILSIDMLPEDPIVLKSSFTEDNFETFSARKQLGYVLQYSRNTLQLNKKNGTFSEIGGYSGVNATDWSWAPLWVDFDNDGWKDLFVSNGIPKRYNDMDFVKYSFNNYAKDLKEKDAAYFEQVLESMIEMKLKNKFYANNRNYFFQDIDEEVENNPATYSNGAIYADLDNDGDLDIVVNNINESPVVYRNNYVENGSQKNAIKLILKGSEGNRNAVGARALLYSKNEVRSYYKSPVRGFLSSMETPILIGTNKTKIDSLVFIWPDHTWQKIPLDSMADEYTVEYKVGLPGFDYQSLHATANEYNFTDITDITELLYKHRENRFSEFFREPLLAHSIDAQGPALAISDINHDGLEDIFVGSSMGSKPTVFLQYPQGTFTKTSQPAFETDSLYEEVDAEWTDVNGDGHPDLLVANGGNEFLGNNIHHTPRAFLNDGKGNLTLWQNAFENVFSTASVICKHPRRPWVFVGSRCVTGQYGQIPDSYLMEINDTAQPWTNITDRLSEKLGQVGMITDAVWYDVNSDDEEDLILTLEWGEIVAFIWQNGKFKKHTLTTEKGWWTSITPLPPTNHGERRFLVGNYGLNHRLRHADQEHPVRLYYNDFDNNGKKEPVITYFLQGKEIPLHSKEELERRIPQVKNHFLFARDFAQASVEEIFGKSKLESASILEADYFANAILQQKGNTLEFELIQLPAEAQFSIIKAATVIGDGADFIDVLCMGNDFGFHQELGQSNALFGIVLRISSNSIETIPSNLNIKGQVRKIKKIKLGEKDRLVLACNNDSLVVLDYKSGVGSSDLVQMKE